MIELNSAMNSGSLFFGIKQSLKNSKDLDKAIVSSDCRKNIIDLLKANKIKISISELTKDEIKERLEIEFYCEVFGLKK
jgi:ribosomal protein L30E